MAVVPIDGNVLRLADAVADKRRRRSGAPPPTDSRGLPHVRVLPGELPRIINDAEAALLAFEGHGVYRFGSNLVQVAWDKIRVSGGGHEESLRYSLLGPAGLVEKFATVAHFKKWSKIEADWVACDCPNQVAESYLARDGQWRVPPLLGVVTAPTLRPDGSLISESGYDVETGIIFDPLGVDFGVIKDRPDRGDAEWGLRQLKRLLRRFGFVSDADRSVALSGILTAVVRPAMPVAPMHAFDAPVAGSGKSLLIDIASVIATGHRAAVMSTGSDKHGDNEFEKRLSAAVLGGDPIVSMDNLNEALDGQLLCQLLTQHSVKIRQFRTLQNITVPSTATYFANGNNLVVVGDMTRRVLVGRVDPGVERPELVRHPFRPIDLAHRARPMLVRCVLAIVMAHLASGSRRSDPLGSFDEWSYIVRDALTWLGEADPTDVMENTRSADPKLDQLRSIIRAWRAYFQNSVVKVRDISTSIATGEQDACAAPDLRDALLMLSGGKRNITPEMIGWWLRKNVGRTINIDSVKYRFTSEATAHGANWKLEYDDVSGDRNLGDMVEDVPF